jgi:hypothetical protein
VTTRSTRRRRYDKDSNRTPQNSFHVPKAIETLAARYLNHQQNIIIDQTKTFPFKML